LPHVVSPKLHHPLPRFAAARSPNRWRCWSTWSSRISNIICNAKIASATTAPVTRLTPNPLRASGRCRAGHQSSIPGTTAATKITTPTYFNYWKTFGDNERSWVWLDVGGPGQYGVGLTYHWYATKNVPEHEEYYWASAHFGEDRYEVPDQVVQLRHVAGIGTWSLKGPGHRLDSVPA